MDIIESVFDICGQRFHDHNVHDHNQGSTNETSAHHRARTTPGRI